VLVLVLGVVMTVAMHMSGAVGVHVFVLVKDELETVSEGVGNTAERFQAWDVIATLQARDHRLGHPQPRCQLFLRLAAMGTQLQKLPCALPGKRGAFVCSATMQGRSVAGLLVFTRVRPYRSHSKKVAVTRRMKSLLRALPTRNRSPK
jgi:hypothetical protein